MLALPFLTDMVRAFSRQSYFLEGMGPGPTSGPLASAASKQYGGTRQTSPVVERAERRMLDDELDASVRARQPAARIAVKSIVIC